MIASTAALFAILASLTAGQVFNVLPNTMGRDQAIAACSANGQQLASLTGATIDSVSALLPGGKAGWIASWNGDSYGGACLQLSKGTVTVAGSCQDQLLPICQGTPTPQPPQPPCPPHHESSSSSHVVPPCESSSSSISCESSSSSALPVESSSSSWGCDSSSGSSWGCDSSSSTENCSESYSCNSSFDSSICSSSSSSSSSGHCDPCCAGVRKLTYQAPFGPGIYLAKVTQRFTVFDVFGPNACDNVQALSQTLGVNAVLVASNGTNACSTTDTTPYGAYYTVSRAWALNQPIYALWNGTVYAANSLYNCYGEYRAILLNKSLSELTFVTNNNGNVCFERCKGQRDCLALCNGLPRPSYLPKFKSPQ